METTWNNRNNRNNMEANDRTEQNRIEQKPGQSEQSLAKSSLWPY